MIGAILELLSVAAEVAEPVVGLFFGERRSPSAQPGEYCRARMRLYLKAHIRGRADAVFDCVLEPSMLVQVDDEHFAPNGDALVVVHSLTHAASLPRQHRAHARLPGYLVRVPPLVLAKSFKPVARPV